jgi:hypothetical protein
MGSGELDFLQQIPITVILAPIFFGALYIISMVIIFRRAAERRRKARIARGEVAAPPAAEKPKGWFRPAEWLRAAQPEKPAPRADWMVPAALRGVPEPDLDLLTMPVSMEEATVSPAVELDVIDAVDVVETPPAAEDANAFDWMSGISAASLPQEEIPPMKQDTASVPGGHSDPSDAVEVMRVWRDLSDGSLIIQMGDQRYRSVSEIRSPELVRRFTAVVRELWSMINGTPGRSTGTAPTASEAPGGLKARVTKTDSQPQKPGRLQKLTQQVLGQSTTQQPEPAGGIADAVEEFLQARLAASPQFAARSIHIRLSHDHGVSIEVDGHYYNAIDEVIDPDVRDFLFAIMKEWEARQ